MVELIGIGCICLGVGILIGMGFMALFQIAKRSDRDYETDEANEQYEQEYGSDGKRRSY